MASLSTYNNKRNFKKTAEPRGEKSAKGKALRFVVQRHAASRLHYDFRLELDGVLKSWAVPKGPSMNPADKRLAMMVEDHPLEYRTFEGSIPEGNYGAGEVEIWDKGTYKPDEKLPPAQQEEWLIKQLKTGDLKVVLRGKKLKGSFVLVHMKGGKEDNAWLLIKHKDEFATEENFDAEELTSKNSKVTRALEEKKNKKKSVKKAEKLKDINNYAAKSTPKSAAKKKVNPDRTRKSFGPRGNKLSQFIKPMLATASAHYSEDANWIFETKWDGYRAIAECKKEVRLYSRNGLDFTGIFSAVTGSLKLQPHEMVMDGEIVVYDKSGTVSFQKLQQWQQYPEGQLVYQAFDLLWLNGHSTQGLPLLQRKELLKEAILQTPHLKYADHVSEGKELFEQTLQRGEEGIIAKDATSSYLPGKRSTNWLKIKHRQEDEVIIAGYTAPSGGRHYFGSLLLGQYADGKLVYTGHTGSGFNQKMLKALFEEMQPYVQTQCPFEPTPKTNASPTWLQPVLVATVAFAERTEQQHFRHPVFVGLRPDKEAREVVLPGSQTVIHKKSKNMNDEIKLVSGKKLTLTNQDKLYWPEEKITKGDVIDYYQKMSKWILPYLKNRPQNLHRFPNGITGKSFYHKDAAEQAPSWVKSYAKYSESADKTVDYIVCNHEATLVYLANLGCIEMNPWNSTTKNIDQPTYLIIDLDPSAENTFNQVVEAALATNEVLKEMNVTAFCKTSGASGLHVFVPMGNRYSYDQVKTFAQLIALKVNELLPNTTTLERSLNKRSDSKIYLDYLQNRSGQTIASAYSLRPRAGATVSTPLLWKEVKPGLDPQDFHLKNIEKRVNKMGDLFAPVLGKGIALQSVLKQWS